MKPKIGITMGDPGGIGPEVVLKALSRPQILSLFDPLLIGVPEVFQKASQALKLPVHLSLVTDVASGFPRRVRYEGNTGLDARQVRDGRETAGGDVTPGRERIAVLSCGEPRAFEYGKPSPEGGEVSFQAIRISAELALERKIDAIVTGPINKYSFHLAGHPYPGHTELLSSLAKTEKYAMMLLSGDQRVVLVTTHLPLGEVTGSITEEKIFGVIELTHSSLKSYFKLPNPRIGVCALNPHGGEEGVFGEEEKGAISPAISRALAQGIRVEGPFPSDTLFTRWKEFDSIVAMYHDQGLIPLKLLGFGRGVNLTLGLPFIRTSPDHGTAFDIAGKGVADPGSMIEALKLAARLSTQA